MPRVVVVTLLLCACTSQEEPPAKPDPTVPTDTSDTTGSTDTATDTATDTGTPPEPTIDCSIMPIAANPQFLDIQSSEDFTIGADGLLYGVQVGNGALVRTDHAGAMEMLAPNVSSWGRGTRFLPDGDLVVAEPDNGALLRFDPTTWGRSLIRGGLENPNGIAIDDQGFVFLTQLNGKVLRIDPDTGDTKVLYETPVSTDGIAFAPDFRTLYWNSEYGEIVRVVLDDDGNVIEGPSIHTEIQGFGLLDGMTTDACGRLYVVDMNGRVVLVLPDGTQHDLLSTQAVPGGNFISAVNFGSGYGGFELTKLYVMSLDHGVYEFDVGVEGKHEPHLP